MGFLSSLFQTGTPVPQVAGAPIGVSKLPEELAPYYKDIMGKSQALYNERTAEGFKPYSGPTMADFTPEQQQAFTGIAGLQGSQAPVFQEAMDMTRSAAAPMTQDQMTTYMSPYQQAVTDIEKREATKQYESQVQPALAAQAAATGGFGGSRQAILEGMAADTQQRLLGDIQAKGSQSAYQDAVSRFQADRTAQGQAGAQLATMAPNQFKAQLGEFGALQTVGEEQQKQSQTALDEAFRQYQLERDEPYNTMAKYQSIVTGAPLGKTQFYEPKAPAPSTAQTLLGGIGTLANVYGMFSGNTPKLKEGGGIADNLPIVNAGSGDFLQDLLNKYKYNNVNPLPGEGGEGNFDYGKEKKKKIERELQEQKNEATIRKENAEKNKAVMDSMGLDASRNQSPELAFNPTSYPDPSRKIGKPKAPPGLRYSELKLDNRSPEEKALDINAGVEAVVQKGPEVPEGIASLTQPSILTKPGMPKPIERDLAGEAQVMADARLDKNISDKEQAYLDTITDKQDKLAERGKGLEDERKQEQFMNLAKFFTRIGTVSPRKEGFLGLVDAGLQVSEESLNDMAATNDKIRERKEAIEDKSLDLETLLRKEELGIVLSAAERKEKLRLQRSIDKNTERTLALEEQYKKAQIAALNIPEEIKAEYMKAIESHLDGFTNDLGAMSGLTDANGKSLVVKGKIVNANLQSEIQSLKTSAIGRMHTLGSYAAFVNTGELANVDKEMNALIAKYTAKKVLGPPELENEKPDSSKINKEDE